MNKRAVPILFALAAWLAVDFQGEPGTFVEIDGIRVERAAP